MLSRYLEELVAIQCLVLRPDPSLFPQVTHVSASGLVSLVPILHAFIFLAVVEAIAQGLHHPDFLNIFTRFLCVAPFVGASIFIALNEAYIAQFKIWIAGQGLGEIAKRRQAASVFALVSVVGGAASLLYLILVQGHRNAT